MFIKYENRLINLDQCDGIDFLPVSQGNAESQILFVGMPQSLRLCFKDHEKALKLFKRIKGLLEAVDIEVE